jgi:hypothetical protein
MAIPIPSVSKLSSQLAIEENCLFRNAIKSGYCNGKYDPLSDQINSHFYTSPMARSIRIAMLSLLGIAILVNLSLPAHAQESLVRENEEGQLNPPRKSQQFN